jgi:putative DNA primase/helicase
MDKQNPLDVLINEQRELASAIEPESLTDAVTRLAELPALKYEKLREAEAQRLGVRVCALDKEISIARKTKAEEGGKAAMFPTVESWHEVVDGADVLQEIRAMLTKHIVCSNETAVTATLWVAFTWFIDQVQVAPLAVITAPEKRCGKSQLLNLFSLICYRPLVASNIAPAAVYRVIESHAPTLLIDEADTFMRDNEELRGVINSGHTRQSAYVIRCVGDDHEPRQFSTWGAKALSGIGHLPDTIMDRSVILELRRKLPSESVQRLRHADPLTFKRLASKLARFADDFSAVIQRARPALPDELNDRAQDNWEPLLAIADLAGGDWPRLARHAALKLSGAEQDAVSLSAELLNDIKEVFEHKRVEKISTADLIQSLCDDDEKSWATYNRGKPITPRQVAKKLKEYGVSSKNVRIGYETPKGFDLEQFKDAFTRYLSGNAATSATTPQPSNGKGFHVADDAPRGGTENVKVTPKSLVSQGCGVVADKSGVSSGVMVEVEV